MTVEAKLKISAQTSQAERALRQMAGQLQDLRTQFLGFLGLQQGTQAIAGLANMSDQYQSLRARLRLVTDGQDEFNTALRTTQALSAKYNQPLAETSSLYTRLLSAVKPLNGGLREASVASEAMLASLKISGATSAEAGSAILQFSQALGSGVLRGEEFNAINEAAPRLLDALAKGLGKPKSELKALAEQGALTTSAVVQALAKSLPELQREAAMIPATIGGAYDQLKGKIQQYVGAQAEANGAGKAAIEVLTLLGNHFTGLMNALQALAVVLLAGWLGRAAMAFEGMVLGAAGATLGINIMTAAVGRLWLAIGGPVGGLIVTIWALKEAWDAMGWSRQGASDKTSAQLNKETAALQQKVDELETKKKAKTIEPPERVQLVDLRRQLAELNSEVAKRQTSKEGADELARMLDPAGVKKFEDEYKTRADIVKGYADKRAAYIISKDKEIEAAQRAGNDREVARLQKTKADHLKSEARAEKKELQTFDSDGIANRIAQAKVLYDKDFELLSDATAREKKLVQERFEQGLLDLQTYLAEKARLQNAELNQDIDRLIAKQLAEGRALAENQERLKRAKNGNENEQAQEAVTTNQNKIAELDVEITKKERDRLDAARSLTTEAQQLTSELRDQQDAIETQIKQLKGVESLEDIQRRVQKQFAPELAKAFQRDGGVEGDAVKKVQELIDLTVLRETLSKAEREYARMLENIRIQEDAVRLDEAAGAITVYEAERKIFDIRAAQLPLLRAQLAEVEKISGRLSPEDQARAAQAKNGLKQMGDLRTDAERQIRSSIGSGFSQFFVDIASGTKTVGDALKNMLGNFAQQILNMIAQRLGAQLLESLMPAGGGGVGSGLLSAGMKLFGFHSGGVVGMEGSSFSRNVNAAAFAFAPRYHTGGIAGMAPRRSDEMYAVLQKGEEVLTADDPRHIKNMGAGGGGVAVNITVNGAQGDKAAQGNGAADLGRMVEAVVDQWAIKQSRPGGMLFGRAR